MAEGFCTLSGIRTGREKTHKYLILRRKIPLLLHGQSHFPLENEEEYHLNKTRLVVTRVFDSKRTPQDAFIRAILNSNNADKGLQMPGNDGIIENEEPLCSSQASSVKGEANG